MSALTDIDQDPRMSDLRTYLAGTGATGALIAGAVVVFLSVATFVGFNGLPGGGSGGGEGSVFVGDPSGAPEAAAIALASAPGAVAASPAAAVGPDGTLVVSTGSGTDPGVPGVPPGGVLPPTDGGGGGTTPPPSGGTVGGIVDGVDNTTGQVGLDLGLGDLTDPLTEPLDRTLDNTLNSVGGLLGAPRLGDGVTGAVNGITSNLLGSGGTTDGLLGR